MSRLVQSTEKTEQLLRELMEASDATELGVPFTEESRNYWRERAQECLNEIAPLKQGEPESMRTCVP